MERIELMILTKKYENELRKGNNEHLRDYIGARVILALSLSPVIISSSEISKTTLNSLICPFGGLRGKITEYKVPDLQSLHNIQNSFNLYYKKNYRIPIDMIRSNGAATWLGLMIESKMISEGDTIDLTQYKLIGFINDEKLKKLLGVSEIVNYNLVGNNKVVYDNIIQNKPNKQTVKVTKIKRRTL